MAAQLTIFDRRKHFRVDKNLNVMLTIYMIKMASLKIIASSRRPPVLNNMIEKIIIIINCLILWGLFQNIFRAEL